MISGVNGFWLRSILNPPQQYHSSYYAEKFKTDSDKKLVGVYIDITGNKEIYKRPEMVHLLKDCKNGSINLIFSQTRAYLAANTCDFCFLLKYLFDLPMPIRTVSENLIMTILQTIR